MNGGLLSGPSLLSNLIYRFQSLAFVRIGEIVYLVVSLGGFYLVSFVSVFDPLTGGVGNAILTAIPVEIQIAGTVIVPFLIVLLEWVAGVAQVRSIVDRNERNGERRVLLWLEITTEARAIPTLVYLPLLPVAIFWTLLSVMQGYSYWPILAAISSIDVAIIAAINHYSHYPDPKEYLSRAFFERDSW